jgi:hypothetical protein
MLLMQFLRMVGQSIYSPAFYRDLRAKPLSFSIKYYVSLTAILALAGTVLLAVQFLPSVQSALGTVAAEAVEHFPAELEIVIAKGAASTNVEEPYSVKFTPGVAELVTGEGAAEPAHRNFLVIDTVSPLSLDQFRNYDTFLLLSKNYVLAGGDRGEIRAYPLARVPDIVINKAWVTKVTGELTPYLRFLGPLVVAGVLVFLVAYFAVQLLYLFLAALLVWALLRIKGIKARYGEAYRIGIHAMTLGTLVNALAFAFHPPLGIPFLFTVLLLVVVGVNCKKVDSAAAAPAPSL